jgi:hypothetical protein
MIVIIYPIRRITVKNDDSKDSLQVLHKLRLDPAVGGDGLGTVRLYVFDVLGQSQMGMEVGLSLTVLYANLIVLLDDVLQLQDSPDLPQTASLPLSSLLLLPPLLLLKAVRPELLHGAIVHLGVDLQHREGLVLGSGVRG